MLFELRPVVGGWVIGEVNSKMKIKGDNNLSHMA